MSKIQDRIILDIYNERKRQDYKWGEQNHEFSLWMVILMEEIGEANKAYLESRFGGSNDGQCGTIEEFRDYQRKHTRTELVQCASVLVAMIECMDRNAANKEAKQ